MHDVHRKLDAITRRLDIITELGVILVRAVNADRGDILRAVRQEGTAIMSVLSDKIADVGASVDAAATRVQEDVATLQQQIADLEAQVSQGTATPEDLAALDALKVKLDQIDPLTPTTLPTP